MYYNIIAPFKGLASFFLVNKDEKPTVGTIVKINSTSKHQSGPSKDVFLGTTLTGHNHVCGNPAFTTDIDGVYMVIRSDVNGMDFFHNLTPENTQIGAAIRSTANFLRLTTNDQVNSVIQQIFETQCKIERESLQVGWE